MAAMPTGVKIDATPEQLADVKYDANGLVPAIAQDVRTKARADGGVDERRDAADDARRGQHGLLEPPPPGDLAQGRHER